MADAKKTEADAVVAPPPKKSMLKWIVFAAIGVLVLAGGGTAAFFMLKKPAPAEGAEAAAAPAKKKVDPTAPPVYYKFDKPFTVKLATEQQDAYLQAEVQLKLLDAMGNDAIKLHEPELKHKITLTLMGRKASTLGSSEGVQKLANELRDTINKVVTPVSVTKEKPAEKPADKAAEKSTDGTAPKPPEKAEPAELADPSAVVQSVLFSTFIIQ